MQFTLCLNRASWVQAEIKGEVPRQPYRMRNALANNSRYHRVRGSPKRLSCHSLLAQGKSFYPAIWSRDSRYICFQDLGSGAEEPIWRLRLSDHKIEPIAGLSQFSTTDAMAFSFAGLTPDDSPLASVILNRGDVCALNVDFP